MSDVTQILRQTESADPSAAEQLLPLIYDELRRLAAVRLAQEKPGQTQATALVHEAYRRLVSVGRRTPDLAESISSELPLSSTQVPNQLKKNSPANPIEKAT